VAPTTNLKRLSRSIDSSILQATARRDCLQHWDLLLTALATARRRPKDRAYGTFLRSGSHALRPPPYLRVGATLKRYKYNVPPILPPRGKSEQEEDKNPRQKLVL
jgi:hypothetical protein